MVVPLPGRESVLQELHGGHPGVSHMKSLARGLVVGESGSRDCSHGGAIPKLSAVSALTSVCTHAAVELANESVVTSTYRLCWTCGRKDDYGSH